MKKNIIFRVLLVVIPAISLILMSLSNGAPAGWSGSPGDLGTCYNCHDVTPGNFNASIDISTTIPASGYELSTTYDFTVTLSESGASKHGFALTAERDIDNTKVGTFTPTDSNTRLVNDGGNIAQSNPSSGNSWTFTWTSPSTDPGSITFYAAGNAANGDVGPSGDHVVTTTLSNIPLGVSEARRLEFKLFPNPSIDVVNIQFPSGVLKAEAEIFDYAGRKLISKKISSNDHQIVTRDLASGIYIIRVFAGKKIGVQTLIKN